MNNKIALVILYDGIEPDIDVIRGVISHFSEANKPITAWLLKNEDVANALLQAACFDKGKSKKDSEIGVVDASVLFLVKTFLDDKTKANSSDFGNRIIRDLLTAKSTRQKTLKDAIINASKVSYGDLSQEVFAKAGYSAEHHFVIQEIARLFLDS